MLCKIKQKRSFLIIYKYVYVLSKHSSHRYTVMIAMSTFHSVRPVNGVSETNMFPFTRVLVVLVFIKDIFFNKPVGQMVESSYIKHH